MPCVRSALQWPPRTSDRVSVVLDLLIAFFCVLMVPHVLLIHEQSVIAPLVARMILMGAWYLVGVLFYIFQIPERFFPGMFDLSVRCARYAERC